jgi:hypothetical protein
LVIDIAIADQLYYRVIQGSTDPLQRGSFIMRTIF